MESPYQSCVCISLLVTTQPARPPASWQPVNRSQLQKENLRPLSSISKKMFSLYFIPHAYGSLWRWKHWSVRQIKPAQLAFGHTLI